MAPRSSTSSRRSKHRSTLSLQKTEIAINVYDLLPPGRVSTVLWALGASLLHSGVVISGKEYAYGGHDQRGITGVYWTKPQTEPPGGTFKIELLHGFTLATPEEIDAVLREASDEFLGPSYNLLTKNCNHFTAYLCKKLTGTASPGWLNRAASVGVALPCVVPKDWVEPPAFDSADGELLDEYEDDRESARMLGGSRPHLLGHDEDDSDGDDEHHRGQRSSSSRRGKRVVRDTAGRQLPAAEVATR